MADFKSGRVDGTPVGRRRVLRSTERGSFTILPRTVASASFPTETIDDTTGLKILQTGEAMVVLTSGPDAGKTVPFQLDPATPFTDGRSNAANLVGIVADYFTAQLADRDVEAGIYIRGVLVQEWCTIRDATGARIPLTNTVADALRGKKSLGIHFA